jgi:hypothetical protein
MVVFGAEHGGLVKGATRTVGSILYFWWYWLWVGCRCITAGTEGTLDSLLATVCFGQTVTRSVVVR